MKYTKLFLTAALLFLAVTLGAQTLRDNVSI